MSLSTLSPQTPVALLRTLIFVASAAIGTTAFAQDDNPASQPTAAQPALSTLVVPGTIELGSVDVMNAQVEREERVTVPFPADKPLVVYTFTNRGGSMTRAVLQGPRYTRDAHSAVAGVPADKVAGGPIDLVSTWGPRLLPFTDSFIELDYPGETRITLRVDKAGVIAEGALKQPENRASLTVDKPVREGDLLIVTAPANVAGEYRVKSVGTGGSITPDKDFAAKDATGVDYRVVRVGSAKDLFNQDPTYTRVSKNPGLPLVYVWPDPNVDQSPVWIERRIEAGRHAYELSLVVSVHNVGDKELKVQGAIKIGAWQHPEVGSPSLFGGATPMLQASCMHMDGVERFAFGELREDALDNWEQTQNATALKSFPSGTRWVAADTNYFVQAAVPLSYGEIGGQCRLEYREFNLQQPGAWSMVSTLVAPNSERLNGRADGCVPDWLPADAANVTGAPRCASTLAALGAPETASAEQVRAAYEAKRKQAGVDVAALDKAWDTYKNRRVSTSRYLLYSGPKETDMLEATSAELTKAVQFGWMGFVGAPLHKVMVWFHDGVGNWPLAIILLTIVLKLLTWPLNSKSFVSMQKMKTIKPKLDELKKKYGHDRQKFAQEQMALMRREGVNPFASCLPMLIQIPIWMGLYGAILGSVELYREPLGLWIPDLSASDPYFILPIVLGILMFVQTILTPQAGMEETQAKIMKYGMPIMFTLFMLFLPSGLVLYILVNTILTIGQNLLIKRKMEAAS